MTQEAYIIDTSSLIQIRPENYPRDIYVGMWENLEDLIKEGRLISHIKVLDELKSYEGKKDEILKWAETHSNIFMPIKLEQIQWVRKIVNTNNFRALIDNTKPTGDTDAFIIALAMEKTLYERIVVCEEVLHGNKIKIPFVCNYFNIKSTNVFGMFRNEGWSWR